MLRTSRCCKARLLHYFPLTAEAAETANADEEEAFSSWCGWHNDHGSLTGLVPAMFFEHQPATTEATATTTTTTSSSSGEQPAALDDYALPKAAGKAPTGSGDLDEWSLPANAGKRSREGEAAAAAPKLLSGCPDPSAGLYIRSRKGERVKVGCPADHLAFQIGETAQVHSGGWLQATPHAVRGCGVPHVSRATFAVFMEPEWDYPMTAPDGVEPEHTQSSSAAKYLPKGVPPLRTRWGSKDCPYTTCDFGAFTDVTLQAYH